MRKWSAMALCNTVDVVDIFQHVHYQLSRVGHSYNFGQFLISCMMIPWQPSWFVFQQHRCLLDLALKMYHVRKTLFRLASKP